MIPIRFKILERGIPNLNEEYIGQLIEDCTLVFNMDFNSYESESWFRQSYGRAWFSFSVMTLPTREKVRFFPLDSQQSHHIATLEAEDLGTNTTWLNNRVKVNSSLTTCSLSKLVTSSFLLIGVARTFSMSGHM